MLTTHTKAAPDPDVLSTRLMSGETVLLHLGTSNYFSLNETGSQIWHLMSEGSTLGEISRELESEFDVAPERAQQSVMNLAGELICEKLAHVVTDACQTDGCR